MNRILSVDAVNRQAWVEPGVLNLDLSKQIAHLGVHFAPDPSSQQTCSIGGNVANNSGGPHCLADGVTSAHILAVEVVLPDAMMSDRVDLWAMDCMALPFRTGQFNLATALNLVDCIPGPTDMIVETSRILAPGAGALFTTPYDWSPAATDPIGWMGGHSQRGPLGGAAEPVLAATLNQYGLNPLAESHDVPWSIRVHSRSIMQYLLHLVVCERTSSLGYGNAESE